jgi:hypothetical protein
MLSACGALRACGARPLRQGQALAGACRRGGPRLHPDSRPCDNTCGRLHVGWRAARQHCCCCHLRLCVVQLLLHPGLITTVPAIPGVADHASTRQELLLLLLGQHLLHLLLLHELQL